MTSAAQPIESVQRARGNLLIIAIGAGVLIASAIIPMPVNGRIDNIPTLCVFHLLTGRPCPGCGMTRSFVCLAHGHIREAFLYHPFGPILYGLIAAYVIAAVFRHFGIALPPHLEIRINKVTCYAAVVLMMGIWVARLSGLIPLPRNL